MSTDTRSHRLGGDSGVALVEFALVLPILLMFALGIMDYGMLFKADGQVEHALMSAGRVAGQQSNGRFADYEALRSLSSSLSGIQRATVNKVVIYKAPPDGKVPAACLTGSQAGVCNYYTGAQLAGSASLANFQISSGGGCAGGSWDAAWCPTSRQPQTDRIGLYVEMSYQRFTGIIPGGFTFRSYVVYDVEPTSISSGT